MKDMFYNYDNDIDLELSCQRLSDSQSDATADAAKMLYNKIGEPIGVQIRYKTPINLYFNLRETAGRRDLIDLITRSTIVFKINNARHITIVEKAFSGFNVFNPVTGDILIALSQQETSVLKQECYRMELQLIDGEDLYPLFNELDAYLVIR